MRERCSPIMIGTTNNPERENDQTRLKTSEPFVPPKPKLFFSATSIFIGRALFAQ